MQHSNLKNQHGLGGAPTNYRRRRRRRSDHLKLAEAAPTNSRPPAQRSRQKRI